MEQIFLVAPKKWICQNSGKVNLELTLQYIIPLPRNSKYIDYERIKMGNKADFDGYFKFEKIIRYYSYLAENGREINVFLDEDLKNREEKDYLNRIENEVVDYSMEADHSYMQNNFSLEGWMFVNHIAVQWYYYILQLLRKHELNKKYAVTDFLKMLYEIKSVKINGKWYATETTKSTADIIEKIKKLPVT
jgi:hypothetical protein